MLDQHVVKGAADACAHFGLKLANVPGAAPTGFMDKAKSFGMGQVDAAKALFHNLRGGLGGKYSPDFHGNLANVPEAAGFNRAVHRQQAIGNLKTLAPTLLAGGGLYLLHQRKKQREELNRRQAAAMAAGGLPAYAASGHV